MIKITTDNKQATSFFGTEGIVKSIKPVGGRLLLENLDGEVWSTSTVQRVSEVNIDKVFIVTRNSVYFLERNRQEEIREDYRQIVRAVLGTVLC